MKFIKRVLILILIVVIIIGTIFMAKGKKMYEEALQGTSLESVVESIRQGRNYVKIQNLPQDYINAVIAVEDHRFRDHGAIDFIALGRALWINISTFSLREGGSTITQQVAKNIFYIEETDAVVRKIAEIRTAIDLEKIYSKDEILELYVNTIYFGDGYYGIREACNGYLEKEPSEMNLYDSTMMAGIPNAPSVYAPTANPELTKSRQQKVISDMVEHGYISQEEAGQIQEHDDYDL